MKEVPRKVNKPIKPRGAIGWRRKRAILELNGQPYADALRTIAEAINIRDESGHPTLAAIHAAIWVREMVDGRPKQRLANADGENLDFTITINGKDANG